jgi:hypothetical protein
MPMLDVHLVIKQRMIIGYYVNDRNKRILGVKVNTFQEKNKLNAFQVFFGLLLLLVPIFLLAYPKYGTTDDYILDTWFNGYYTGNFENEAIFVTSIFSKFISSMYAINSTIAWYGLTLLIVTLSSVAAISQIIINSDKISRQLKLTILLILFLFTVWSYLGITYTSTAIISGVAGLIMLLNNVNNTSRFRIILPIIFLSISFIIRPESLLGAILVLYPLYILKVKINKKSIKHVLITFIALLSLFFVNKFSEERESSEIQQYREWAKKVQMFAGRPRMDAAARVIGETGWTPTEYNLFKDVAYLDEQNYNPAWIDQALKATDFVSTKPDLSFGNLKNVLNKYVNSTSFFLMFLPILLIAILFRHRPGVIKIGLSFYFINFGLLHIYTGLFLHNVPRVTTSLLVGFMAGLMLVIKKSRKDKKIEVMFSIIIALLGLYYIQDYNSQNRDRTISAKELSNSINEQLESKILLIHGNQEYSQNVNPFKRTSREADQNVFMVGNWDTFSPHWKERALNIGLNTEEIIKELTTNPKVVWSGPTIPNTTLNLINYLRESGYGEFQPQKIGTLTNGNELWSFSDSEVEIK